MGRPAHAAVAAELTRRIIAHNRRLASPAMAWLGELEPPGATIPG